MNVTEQKPQFGVNYDVGYDAFTCHPRDFLTAGIDWFERWDALPGVPPASHALKIVGPDQTIEALSHGIVYGNLSDYLNDPMCALMVRKPIQYTPDMADRMLKEAKSHLGEKYNYMLIVMMAIGHSYLGHWIDEKFAHGNFSRWLEKLADSKRKSICSQFVARVDNEMVELRDKSVLRFPPYDITPVLLIGDPVIYEPGTIELLP
jgi:hypothetical protein